MAANDSMRRQTSLPLAGKVRGGGCDLEISVMPHRPSPPPGACAPTSPIKGEGALAKRGSDLMAVYSSLSASFAFPRLDRGIQGSQGSMCGGAN